MAASPTIVAIAHDRPASLARLLGSIARADTPAGTSLIVSIDGGGNPECVTVAERFDWSGEKRIIQHDRNLGLREHVLSCGDLSQEHGPVILLEDDVVVAPRFYEFARQAVAHYETDDRIAGISLYSQRYNETARCIFEPLHDGFPVFMAQLPSSWGEAFTRQQWLAFRKWLAEGEPDFGDLPRNVQEWSAASWKKRMAAFAFATGRWFVYPYAGFSTNMGDPGIHTNYRDHYHQGELASDLQTLNFPALEEAVRYDQWWELVDPDIEWDVYGTKHVITGDRVLSPRRLPGYRQTAGFGIELRPIQMNYYLGNEGDAFWLNEREPGGPPLTVEPSGQTTRRLARTRTGWLLPGHLVDAFKERVGQKLRKTLTRRG